MMIRGLLALFHSTEPYEFRTRMSCDQAVASLRSVISGPVLTALTQEAIIGSVSKQKVVLQRRIPFVQNSFKPYFIGRFSSESGQTVLRGVFTMHWATKAFMTLWFGFGAIWVLLNLFSAMTNPVDTWFLPFAGLAVMSAGLVLVRFAKWLARNDQQRLLDVISKALVT